MPTAIRLALAAASSTASARGLLGSSRRAWAAVVSASSFHTVDHTQTPKTSARMSQPISGAARPVPATAAAVPPATPAARDTSSFVPAVDTRGTFGRSADSGCITSACQPASLSRAGAAPAPRRGLPLAIAAWLIRWLTAGDRPARRHRDPACRPRPHTCGCRESRPWL